MSSLMFVKKHAFYCARNFGSQSYKKVRIKDILQGRKNNESADVQGWTRSVRKMKNHVFVDINDGSTAQNIQLVMSKDLFDRRVQFGTSISVRGKIQQSIQNEKNKYEILCDDLDVLGTYAEDAPLKKNASYDMQHLRSLLHLRMRHYKMAGVLRARNCVEMAMHKFFQEKGFLHIHTPILTSSDCETGGNVFSVQPDQIDEQESSDSSEDFFGAPAFLSVSGQLHLEACAMGMGDVYTLSPAFRSEKSHTRKHLNEFRMLEAELAHSKDLADMVNLMESSVKYLLQELLLNCSLDLATIEKDSPGHLSKLEKVASKQYVIMSYTEAIELLEKHQKHLQTASPSWGEDLNSDHETFLVQHCDSTPVFIVDFPSCSKPFYMPVNSDGKTVAAVDLIFPEVGELCGGSLRESDLDKLTSRLTALGLLPAYEWYLDLRRYGNTPHAGYGMGFDRFVTFALDIRNIRDAVPFPRYKNSCVL
uniref:asparagine--tRNA ligase n=1 Tax=Phallusia mammillata TaxID=59560 RepID=A0A6F9DMK5_9ASCI|nr:probable asparagine--tRNA ligase, mitochondrial [Phallusia mammillata]